MFGGAAATGWVTAEAEVAGRAVLDAGPGTSTTG